VILPEPSKPIEQQTEAVLSRLLLWGEARGEGAIGMLAVLWCAYNRLGKNGTSLRDVILKPWQFSTFNRNDSNRDKLLKAHVQEPDAYKMADTVATLMEAGHTNDPTHGATHYCTDALWGRPKEFITAKWFEDECIADGRTKETFRHGHHVFGITA